MVWMTWVWPSLLGLSRRDPLQVRKATLASVLGWRRNASSSGTELNVAIAVVLLALPRLLRSYNKLRAAPGPGLSPLPWGLPCHISPAT